MMPVWIYQDTAQCFMTIHQTANVEAFESAIKVIRIRILTYTYSKVLSVTLMNAIDSKLKLTISCVVSLFFAAK